MVLTDFGIYLTIGMGVAGLFMFLGVIFGMRDNNRLGILEVVIGWLIWTAILTGLSWVIHMIALGAGYID